MNKPKIRIVTTKYKEKKIVYELNGVTTWLPYHLIKWVIENHEKEKQNNEQKEQ